MALQAFNERGEKIQFALYDTDYVVDDKIGDSIEVLTLRASDTARAVSDIDSRIRTAISDATRLINEQFRDELHAARIARAEAQKVLEAAKVAEKNSNPLIGKRVIRIDRKFESRFSSRQKEVIVYGVVETVTPQTVFPSNLRYGIPKPGDAIVRLEKNDGTLGAKFEAVYFHDDGTISKGWKVEDAK